MALATFKIVATRPAEVEGRTVQTGDAIAVLAAETESRVRWIFGRMGWSAFELVKIEEAKQDAKPQTPDKGGKK
jgi:hypothetical protein